jgi:hypothetical protein
MGSDVPQDKPNPGLMSRYLGQGNVAHVDSDLHGTRTAWRGGVNVGAKVGGGGVDVVDVRVDVVLVVD